MIKRLVFLTLLAGLSCVALYAADTLNLNVGVGTTDGNGLVSSQGANLSINVAEPANDKELSGAVKALIVLTILSLAPAIFVLCTSFIRIIIVLSILRQAIGLQQLPPNQILVGFAMFLTMFNMLPVIAQINKQAVQPYYAKTITWQQAVDSGIQPLKKFMLSQTRDEDLAVFLSMVKERPTSRKDLSIFIAIPAFVLSELKVGFEIGFILYIPFLVVDMIVASILMSMGMMMLPPVMISLPFKILLFVLIDGWRLVTDALLRSFH
jgi:flagellar biosynthetic protein FliP